MSEAFSGQVTGIKELQARLALLGKDVVKATDRALSEEAHEIIADAKRNYVPVDQGTLRDSGIVEPVKGGTVRFGFGGAAAPYAAAINENPRAGKTGGWGKAGPTEVIFRRIRGRIVPIGAQRTHWATTGGYKFLERPFLAATKGMSKRIADRIRQLALKGR